MTNEEKLLSSDNKTEYDYSSILAVTKIHKSKEDYKFDVIFKNSTYTSTYSTEIHEGCCSLEDMIEFRDNFISNWRNPTQKVN